MIKRVREGQEYYVYPGGEIENEESLEQAAVRETFEELGVHISIKIALELLIILACSTFSLLKLSGGHSVRGKAKSLAGKLGIGGPMSRRGLS
ncbi:NUDIX domain-containing protein [Sporosarcina sp. SG10008]|uniref:NUDIX domain-containing protein n=1 Tax=Sporosarcina sp. SG10008 TaxID=3373103 RepID=UPI0037DD5489